MCSLIFYINVNPHYYWSVWAYLISLTKVKIKIQRRHQRVLQAHSVTNPVSFQTVQHLLVIHYVWRRSRSKRSRRCARRFQPLQQINSLHSKRRLRRHYFLAFCSDLIKNEWKQESPGPLQTQHLHIHTFGKSLNGKDLIFSGTFLNNRDHLL